MKLTNKARYGLRALCHVASVGKASMRVIAKQQAIPARYLEEIIRELRDAGLVVGRRGPTGGYRLAKPADQIVVSEVLRAVEGPPPSPPALDTPDQIAMLVERTVDHRLEALVTDLRLSQLMGEAETIQQVAAEDVAV